MSEQRLVTLPLQGKRILVTRTRDQASALSERLGALGAIPVEFPTIHIVPPSDWQQLDAALKQLYAIDSSGRSYYDWFVLTSANGVRICCERLRSLGYDLRAIRNVRFATIGPATAAALERYGITADLIPGEYIAEGVAVALMQDVQRRGLSLQGQRILLARAAEARKVLVTELQEAGAEVDEVAAYYTLPVASDNEQGHEVLRLLQNRQLDVLTFTSSSTVRNFVAWLRNCGQGATGQDMVPLDHVAGPARPTIACIGPITSQTARELGLHIDIEAKEFTIEGLVGAIVQHEERI